VRGGNAALTCRVGRRRTPRPVQPWRQAPPRGRRAHASNGHGRGLTPAVAGNADAPGRRRRAMSKLRCQTPVMAVSATSTARW